MPVRFSRLRIAGFKSFAEPATVEILPGLTGIVGPNGCGKSNVVEALRWAMGESSARSLRGGEMDDLIFAGTSARAARNLAEVTITLEEAAGLAPQPFHEQHELQISRRIERGAGSAYRVNGRDMRARDVQTLFADLASGARSSAMVSQGRVAAIVGARPEERRSILEEAAGITGLHARRHEAELKLRATEANLARAEDLRVQLEARLGTLQRQAEQAARYRIVSSGLRDTETALNALLHARTRDAVARAAGAIAATQAARLAAEQAADAAAAQEARATAALPSPREEEAVARTLLERRRIETEGLEEDAARAAEAFTAAQQRLRHAEDDAAEAAARHDDAEAAAQRLEAERAALDARDAALPAAIAEASEALAAAASARAAALDAAHRATATLAAETARAAQARSRHAEAQERLARLGERLAAVAAAQDAALAALPGDAARAVLAEAETAARAEHAAARAALEQAEQARAAAAAALTEARAAQAELARRHQDARRRQDEVAARLRRLDDEGAQLDRRQEEARRALVPGAQRQQGTAQVAALEAAQVEDADRLAALAAARNEAGTALAEARAQAGGAQARHRQAQEALRAAEQRVARIAQQHDTLSRDCAAARAALVPQAQLDAVHAACAAAEAASRDAAGALEQAERHHGEAREGSRAAAAALAEARAMLARLDAQAEGLAQSLAASQAAQQDQADGVLALAERIAVPPGLEAALAAALGEALDAPLHEGDPAFDANQYWLALPPLEAPPPPRGTASLAALVPLPREVAPSLARALAHAFVCDGDLEALQEGLRPGQCLIGRDGAIRRWDGFVSQGGRQSPAALRLEQRNRLAETKAARDDAAAALPEATRRSDACRQQEATAAQAERDIRAARSAAETTLAQARQAEAALSGQAAQRRSRLDALTPQLARLEVERHEAGVAEVATRDALATAADPAQAAEVLRLAQGRDAEAVRQDEAARQAARARDAALAQARRELAQLLSRHAEAESRVTSLTPQQGRLAEERRAAEAARAEIETLTAGLGDPQAAQEALEAAVAADRLARDAEAGCRAARDRAETAAEAARAARAELAARAVEQQSRIDALLPQREALEEEHATAVAADADAADALAALPDPLVLSAQADTARAGLDAAQAAETTAREALAALEQERTALATRREALQAEHASWAQRRDAAAAQRDSLAVRLAGLRSDFARAEQAPGAARARRTEAASALDAALAAHQAAQAALAQAETGLAEAGARRRAAEAALVEAREAALRAEAQREQADAAMAALAADGRTVPEAAEGPVPQDLSEAAETALRRKLARLTREREEMGPVNLRAEIEAQEIDAQASAIQREREELDAAIARLRGTIGGLNREGRERLTAVFQQIDAHFQALFARMFNGGRAHLGLVGSDDPLEAGLEIYAQPPGKKLATLSLLSGGEQALTALSLIFAVFRCNPAPICVLDEVDAPLDDANVQRFATLLADMVAETGTRFMVVTHHQLTMAHMDRLYGVTMQERGVSRLLSVDLQAASVLAGQERGST